MRKKISIIVIALLMPIASYGMLALEEQDPCHEHSAAAEVALEQATVKPLQQEAEAYCKAYAVQDYGRMYEICSSVGRDRIDVFRKIVANTRASNRTVVDKLAEAITGGKCETVISILSRSSNPEELVNSEGIFCDSGGHSLNAGSVFTFLTSAILSDNVPMVKILLIYGADPNKLCSCCHSISPLGITLGQLNLQVTELLLKHGANPQKIACEHTIIEKFFATGEHYKHLDPAYYNSFVRFKAEVLDLLEEYSKMERRRSF